MRDIPNPLVANFDHLSQLGELLREVHHAIRIFAATVDVISINGAIVMKELKVFLDHSGSQRFEVCGDFGWPGAEQRHVDHGGQHFVAAVVEVNAIDG